MLVTWESVLDEDGLFRRGIGPLTLPLTSSCLIFTSELPSSVIAMINLEWDRSVEAIQSVSRDLPMREIGEIYRGAMRAPENQEACII